MTMAPVWRKFLLTAHIASSVSVLGSIATFLVLALAGLMAQQQEIVRAAYLAMDVTVTFAIIPLIVASLLTGLIQSLGTSWGLFRHYWIVTKLLLTAFASAVLLAKLELIDYAARLAGESVLPSADLRAAGMELAVHAAGGLLVLLVPAVLSVYKPWGLTLYGRRKQHEQRAMSQRPFFTPERPPLDAVGNIGIWSHGGSLTITVRRVHVLGIIGIVLILHFAVLHFTGIGHGGH